MLLGIPGDNTYANYQEANRAFYRLTVLPMMARTAKELSAWLGPVFGDGAAAVVRCRPDRGTVRRARCALGAVGGASFLSDDEKREAVGYRPQGSG